MKELINRLEKEKDDLDDCNRHLYNENKRLNNIIEELEKELKEVYEEYIDVEDISLKTMAQTCEVILGKIQYLKELKEGK